MSKGKPQNSMIPRTRDGKLEYLVNGEWREGIFCQGFVPRTYMSKAELRAMGYAVVSRKYKIIARTEPGWLEVIGKSLRGPNSVTADRADFYRRMHSRDCLVVGNVEGMPNSRNYLSEHDQTLVAAKDEI